LADVAVDGGIGIVGGASIVVQAEVEISDCRIDPIQRIDRALIDDLDGIGRSVALSDIAGLDPPSLEFAPTNELSKVAPAL
jgi:hypothetical protein